MFDVSENEGFELIEAGKYEAYVLKYDPISVINGVEMTNITYKIRSDVEQKYKEREVSFDRFIYDSKMKWKISNLAKALGFFENAETSKEVNGVRKLNFNSFEDFLQACVGKPLVIEVKHNTYTNKNNKEVTAVNVCKYEPTTFIDFTAPVDEASFLTVNDEDLNTDDLPF